MLPRAASAATILLVLAGCTGVSPSVDDTDAPSPSTTVIPSPSPSTDAIDLPGGAVLGLSVAAAAPPGGGSARVTIVVRQPVAAGSTDAAQAVARAIDTCPGELDEAVLVDQAFSFVPVDISIEPDDWSPDLFLDILPRPIDGTIAAVDGELRQAEDVSDEEGAATPRCLQPALTAGVGGTLFLGVPGAATDPAAALDRPFGVDSAETGVELRDCRLLVADGVEADEWVIQASPTTCQAMPST